MTGLVLSGNYLLTYAFWEGVGVCSYLLVGFWHSKPAASAAAMKAFLVNRVGDVGFAIAIFWLWAIVPNHDLSYTNVLSESTLHGLTDSARVGIPLLLFWAATAKSAQVPLYVWLPDAMEGPTPVSALIHAATMVTAGVYMIARCGTLFAGNADALQTVAVVGTFTALFAATIALRQFDLKKVFAYSTISQLGFMFAGVGLLGSVPGVFHLVTHAFFKALLFLSSGVVMHAMLGELDMRKMSGLKRVLPKTRLLMLIGCLALSGFPFFSGFYSKDEIVGAAWLHNLFLGVVMLLTAFLTAYYTFRLYFRVFRGPLVLPEAPAGGHGHGHA